jgi:hypothetical protein
MNGEFENLKSLSSPAMVASTEGWVTPGPVHTALSGIEEVSGFLGKMSSARDGLLNVQVTEVVTPEMRALKALSDEASTLDATYDRQYRSLYHVLFGNQLAASDEADQDAMASLLKRMFPKGLRMVNTTFLEESGEASLAKQRITEADRGLLAQIPAWNGTALSLVEAWIATGEKLGDVERRRAQLAEQVASSSNTVSQSDVLTARNQWIRVVRAILSGLALTDDVDEQTLSTILQPLRNAVDKAADRRRSGGDSSAIEAPATESAVS